MTWVAEARASRTALWVEFLGLYLAVPLVLAVALPPNAMFSVLFLFTVIGVWLLGRTPGFRWDELREGVAAVRLLPVLAFAAVTFAASWAVIQATAPEAAFGLWRTQPLLLAMIFVFYPLMSALPQELVFRPLFFRRYAGLVPPGIAIPVNAALFSLAHLMYWSGVVAVMTFFGGLVFAYAYRNRGSFALAVVLHAVAGWAIFAVGLGIFFYSGNVQRPF